MSQAILWTQFLAAIEPYAIGFTIALFSVGTMAVYTWGRQRGLQGQVDQLAKGAGAHGAPQTVTVTVPQAQAAGGKPPLAAPVWNQLNDPLPDGGQDPYQTVDCGEECVSMAIAAQGGPDLPAYILRALLGPNAGLAGTNGNQLVYLLRLFKMPAHVRVCDADTAWVEWGHSFGAGLLVIALGYWVDIGYPHWVLIREADEHGICFNDPWGGQQKTMTKEQAQKVYLGQYVHLDARVSGLAPAPPVA